MGQKSGNDVRAPSIFFRFLTECGGGWPLESCTGTEISPIATYAYLFHSHPHSFAPENHSHSHSIPMEAENL